MVAAILAAIVALQLGAFSVILQTVLSGISMLPIGTFILFMQPIHLAIGFVEGLATAAVVFFIWKTRPEMIQSAPRDAAIGKRSFRKVIIGLLVATVVTGGILSWFASNRPDGLEWSIFKASGTEELEGPGKGIHTSLEKVQEKTALLPDYNFKAPSASLPLETSDAWPVADGGTTVAGLIGGAITLILAVSIGFALKRRKR
jgi:cobalt/nickel transport system permease protein